MINLEKLIPSYHNVVTVAALQVKKKISIKITWYNLQALCEMHLKKRVVVDSQVFQDHVTYGHYEQVRLTALRCLVKVAPT